MQWTAMRWACRAYPRSRGATVVGWRAGSALPGLSPLTRGNRGCSLYARHCRGPIPAHAGQPAPVFLCGNHRGAYPRSRGATDHQRRAHWLGWAYPRSRGATDSTVAKASPAWGLSPLTRGNPHRLVHPGARRGPIPAHAGQPNGLDGCFHQARAYPRSRGATAVAPSGVSCHLGLSPLTRGNRRAG